MRVWVLLLTIAVCLSAQVTPDVSKAAQGDGWIVKGRKASAFEADGKKGIRFDQGLVQAGLNAVGRWLTKLVV